MTDITVPVPDDRTAEFFQFFGLWLAGDLSLSPKGPQGLQSLPEGTGASQQEFRPWADTPEDVEDAAALWKKFSPRARAMFSLLIDNPGKEFTGEQIAEAVKIPHGAYGV